MYVWKINKVNAAIDSAEAARKDARELDVGRQVSLMLIDESRKVMFIGTADDDLPGNSTTLSPLLCFHCVLLTEF